MVGDGVVIGEGVEEQEDDVDDCEGGFVVDDIVDSADDIEDSGDLGCSVIFAAAS